MTLPDRGRCCLRRSVVDRTRSSELGHRRCPCTSDSQDRYGWAPPAVPLRYTHTPSRLREAARVRMEPAGRRSCHGESHRRRGSGRSDDSSRAVGDEDGRDRWSAAAAASAADAGKHGKDRSDAAEELEARAAADVGTPTPVECCTAVENRAVDSPQGEPPADYNWSGVHLCLSLLCQKMTWKDEDQRRTADSDDCCVNSTTIQQ